MNPMCKQIRLSVLPLLFILAISAVTVAQVIDGKEHRETNDATSQAEQISLQKKADEAQTRISKNEDDTGQLMRAVKLNEVALAKEVLLRNGFTAKDLENAKITLLTGGGKEGEDKITISAACCDPKEIKIQRALGHFTK